jgi:hypothetical protein
VLKTEQKPSMAILQKIQKIGPLAFHPSRAPSAIR